MDPPQTFGGLRTPHLTWKQLMSPLQLDRLPRPNNRYKKVTRHFCTAWVANQPRSSPRKLLFFVFSLVKIGKKRPPKGMNIYLALQKSIFSGTFVRFLGVVSEALNGLGLPRLRGKQLFDSKVESLTLSDRVVVSGSCS